MRPAAALLLALLAAPPPFAKASEGEQDDKATPKIALTGILMVEGISFKQGQTTKYTGDTYLVKILFSNEKGDPYQPTPTLNFVVYNGNEPYKKVQRIVRKEQWNADAAKVNKETVADNTIACDKKSGELWVAFVREANLQPKIDLTIEIKGAGTWTWKGVDLDSKYEVPAKGPDPKK